jgi:hypothetical protein
VNGIKAHVVFMDKKFEELNSEERKPYDWVVL